MIEGRRKAREDGVAQGILKAVKDIVQKMIKMNFEDSTINQVTGAEKSEIEKIRKEMSFN